MDEPFSIQQARAIDLSFDVGGKKMNLYDLENEIDRAQFTDARIHFAINCGSSSCPVLRRDAFDAKAIEEQLEAASANFVNDGKSVVVDDEQKKVRMPKIFESNADDFVAFTNYDWSVNKGAGPVAAAIRPALVGPTAGRAGRHFPGPRPSQRNTVSAASSFSACRWTSLLALLAEPDADASRP